MCKVVFYAIISKIKGVFMKEFKSVPVTVITGYLGSGKTTLLNNILKNDKGYKIAVIVNDIGEVNIDADLIEKGGVVNAQDESLVPLQNGCICCTLKQDLIDQICGIVQKQKFDHIVIEASGICEPVPIAQTVVAIGEMCRENKMPEICHLDAVVSVVDAARLADEFDYGNALTKDDLGDEDLENLVFQQLEFCNVIVLNKIDEISKSELAKVKAVIKTIQPVAKIIETNYSSVDLNEIIDTNLFDFEKVASSAGWIKEFEKEEDEHDDECDHDHHECHCHKDDDKHECHCHDDVEHDHECHCHDEHEHDGECRCHEHDDGECCCNHEDNDHECHCHEHNNEEHEEHKHKHGHCHCHHHHGEGETEEYGIGTYVYARRNPFDAKKFAEFCEKNWGRNIIRAKGICYFSNDLSSCYLFESAGRKKSLTMNGAWWATMPQNELNALKIEHPELFKNWDEKYGDREIKLVFIGQHLNKEKLKQELDNI